MRVIDSEKGVENLRAALMSTEQMDTAQAPIRQDSWVTVSHG